MAYNDSQHSVTEATPFQVYYGYHPKEPTWPSQPLGEGESPQGYKLTSRLINIRQEAKSKLEAARKYQKDLQDRKRLPLDLKLGDKVWVSNRHMRSTRPSHKLDWKWLGPGKVVQYISDPPTAYRVELSSLGQVHPVFYPSLLEPFSTRSTLPHPQEPITNTLRQYGDDVFEVESIINRRQNENGQYEYLIK